MLSLFSLVLIAGCAQQSDDDKVVHVEDNPPAMMEDEKTETPAADVEGAVKEFTVEGSSFQFAPNTMTVKEGDTVRVTFKNVGGTHDFVLSEFDARTSVISSGAQQTVEFVASKKGSFEYYCSVGDHRALGMVGTLIVE